MRPTLFFTLAAGVSLTACATNPFSKRASLESRTTAGVLAGAAVGAAAGTAIGANAVAGAAAGMVAGGAVGALVKGPLIKDRQYYRDTRGYCYYVDPRGKPRRARSVKC
jgi:uncharacterized protein YcfJ